MSNDLPKAQTINWRRAAQGTLRLLLQSGVVSIALGLGYLVTQLRCKNKAITFAHILNPALRCEVVNTTWFGMSGTSDVAVCRKDADGSVWRCEYKFYDDAVDCKPL
jgi:hypothetical protein